MGQVNDKLKTAITRTEQLKNQRKLRERRNQEAKRKMDVRLNILIGELVCRYFSEMMHYQPQRSNMDNMVEFTEFEDTLIWLSSHAELLRNMRDKPLNEC